LNLACLVVTVIAIMYSVLAPVCMLQAWTTEMQARLALVKVLSTRLSRSGPSPPHHFQLHRELIDVLHVYGGLPADRLHYSSCWMASRLLQ
jgi:hypothetical protein